MLIKITTKLAIAATLTMLQASAHAGTGMCPIAGLAPMPIGTITGDPEKDTFGYDLRDCLVGLAQAAAAQGARSQAAVATPAGLTWTCAR